MLKNKKGTRSSKQELLKTFSNFSGLDEYFCKLFSPPDSIFSRVQYKNAPIGLALQHNLYDYYRNKIYNVQKSPWIQRIRSEIRYRGFDHRLKLQINRFITSASHPKRKFDIIFFAGNYVPRILDDFLKVIAELDTENVAFFSTDRRAYRYMLQKRNGLKLEVGMVPVKLEKQNSSSVPDFKKIVDAEISPMLMQEFGDMAHSMTAIIKSNLPVLASYFDIFENFIDEYCPSKIILGSDGFSIARTLCFAASKKNVSTYVLQHGLVDSLNGYLPLIADHIIVWSENEARIFSEAGVGEEKLFVAGSPRFDQFNMREKKSSGSIKKLLFVISPGVPQDVVSQIDAAIAISKKLTGKYTIIVRPHPYYRMLCETYLQKTYGTAISIDNNSFINSLSEADLVLFADISTGVFESLASGKPTFILKNESENKLDIYKFKRIGREVLTKALIEDAALNEYNLLHSESERSDNQCASKKIASILMKEEILK